MRKILIGSKAIKHHYPDFNREPKDTDYAVDINCSSPQKLVEYLYNPILFKYFDGDILSPSMLLSLKISHLFWDINWDKHMWDVQFLLSKGVRYNIQLVEELRLFWEDYLPKIHRSNLSMSKQEFFTNAVNYDEAEHDYLHTLLHPTPAYTLILADNKEVELDENKWYNLSYDSKCRVVFEETAVMAFERHKSLYYKRAYTRMLKKCIISHFPQYISLFAIENYISLSKPNFNFINTIQDGLEKTKRSIA